MKFFVVMLYPLLPWTFTVEQTVQRETDGW